MNGRAKNWLRGSFRLYADLLNHIQVHHYFMGPDQNTSQPRRSEAPVHRRVHVHLSGFKLFVGQFLLQAELAVGFILFWTAYVGLVMRRIRENVVGLSIL